MRCTSVFNFSSWWWFSRKSQSAVLLREKIGVHVPCHPSSELRISLDILHVESYVYAFSLLLFGHRCKWCCHVKRKPIHYFMFCLGVWFEVENSLPRILCKMESRSAPFLYIHFLSGTFNRCVPHGF